MMLSPVFVVGTKDRLSTGDYRRWRLAGDRSSSTTLWVLNVNKDCSLFPRGLIVVDEWNRLIAPGAIPCGSCMQSASRERLRLPRESNEPGLVADKQRTVD